WKWAAAVYSQLSSNWNTLGVKPVDDNSASAYQNSDHAGTPENYKAYVTGGATGGGGSNWTGGYSGTASATPVPGANQRAADWSSQQGSPLGSLTYEQVHPILTEALARWAAAGATPEEIQALDQTRVVVADQPDGLLGWESLGTIWLSPNAA